MHGQLVGKPTSCIAWRIGFGKTKYMKMEKFKEW